MPTVAGLPIRGAKDVPRWLVVAFALYAASTLISMATMSIGAGVLGLALLIGLGGPRGVFRELRDLWQVPWIRAYVWASVALMGACLLSLIVAEFAPLGWGSRYVHALYGEGMAKTWYFAWPVLLAAGLRKLDEPGRRVVLKTWIVTFAVISIVGIIQHFTGWPRPQRIPGVETRFHATLFLGHHLSVASILIFPFFATLDFIRKPQKILPPWMLGLSATLGFITLFLTYSRILWIALPAGLALWVLRALPRKQAIATLVVAAVAVVAASRHPYIQHRIYDAIGIGDRQMIWKANVEFLRLRPLTGAGFRRNIEASALYLESIYGQGYIFVSHAHNNLLDMLGGTGVVGASAWIFWWIVVFRVTWNGMKARGDAPLVFAWGLLCCWVVFHINGLTQVNFWEGKVMHQMMWAVAWSFLWVLPERA
jgi:hypothetical protein